MLEEGNVEGAPQGLELLELPGIRGAIPEETVHHSAVVVEGGLLLFGERLRRSTGTAEAGLGGEALVASDAGWIHR